jgi:hypothetical protein
MMFSWINDVPELFECGCVEQDGNELIRCWDEILTLTDSTSAPWSNTTSSKDLPDECEEARREAK